MQKRGTLCQVSEVFKGLVTILLSKEAKGSVDLFLAKGNARTE